ncbi:hypothetical protein C7B61_07630 [filamentous cyanobacterium CCP1]|nr:hypothetical protein C7B76_18380 [filamentous cyanobacterium CCP2]PSB67163.1 hypothetical protein C7B61_07630 [filamentous cyanobacterium CCP1]
MEKRTITQVVVEVLQVARQPMSAADITQVILEKSLYTFSTKDPKSIVRGSIERHCEGSTRKELAAKKFFKKLADGKYELISDGGSHSH